MAVPFETVFGRTSIANGAKRTVSATDANSALIFSPALHLNRDS